MPTPNLSYAIPQLPSGDLQRTLEFLRDRLGFTDFQLFADHGHLIARRGQAEVHFWHAGSETDAKKFGSTSSCYIRVENIKVLYGEFRAREAPFRYELTQQPWGMNEMQVDDPYGNAIRFGEPAAV